MLLTLTAYLALSILAVCFAAAVLYAAWVFTDPGTYDPYEENEPSTESVMT